MNRSPPLSTPPRAKGWLRLRQAAGYSWAGLRAGWHEPAFRQETLIAAVLVPAAFWVGRSWTEVALLAGSVVLVMVVELLNTAIESVVDRVSPEWHALSKRAKDLG
ncbi:MAG: diacylglycerol kinase, partial [Tepidimonas taiwanensis]|nr:diacylglycerol kinase [Tepidimonas taiwanensis]